MFDNKDIAKKGPCVCSGDGMFLTNRHLSWIVSGAIFIGFLTFMAGYFLGQKRASEQFCNRADQESLADKVYSSMYALSELEPDTQPLRDVSVKDMSKESTASSDGIQQIDLNGPGVAQVVPAITEHYYAQLAGFGTIQAANNFVKRLAKSGCKTVVKTCQSKTAKGRVVTWHQVVTEQFSSKPMLKKMVERLTKKEHLKGVRIVSC